MFRGSTVLIPLAPTVSCQRLVRKNCHNAVKTMIEANSRALKFHEEADGMKISGSILLLGQNSEKVAWLPDQSKYLPMSSCGSVVLRRMNKTSLRH